MFIITHLVSHSVRNLYHDERNSSLLLW